MSTKLNLKDRDQMATPNAYTDNLKSNLTCIFLSVRAKFKKKKLCPRTLCSTYVRKNCNFSDPTNPNRRNITCDFILLLFSILIKKFWSARFDVIETR